MFKKIGVGLVALGAVVFVAYLRFIRPWQLRWGATNEEVARASLLSTPGAYCSLAYPCLFVVDEHEVHKKR